ncbi:hypothetical protein WV31_04890 [Magnetospirillum sp. ME-1]|nr:hypothetical protein WV31_04890 [Magnetospirillum sp. ME-1]
MVGDRYYMSLPTSKFEYRPQIGPFFALCRARRNRFFLGGYPSNKWLAISQRLYGIDLGSLATDPIGVSPALPDSQIDRIDLINWLLLEQIVSGDIPRDKTAVMLIFCPTDLPAALQLQQVVKVILGGLGQGWCPARVQAFAFSNLLAIAIEDALAKFDDLFRRTVSLDHFEIEFPTCSREVHRAISEFGGDQSLFTRLA